MTTEREQMIAAMTLIKAICIRMSCDECPLNHGGWCEVGNAPCNWEVPKE